jgi:hypothetical protein
MNFKILTQKRLLRTNGKPPTDKQSFHVGTKRKVAKSLKIDEDSGRFLALEF